MKPFHLAITMAAATTLLLGTCGFADEKTEKTVAFHTTADTPGRYVTVAAGGIINTSGLEIADRQIFILVDLNGGEIADGDAVQIKYAPAGSRATYWREGEGVINRTGQKPDDACTFKIKLPEKKDATDTTKKTDKPDKADGKTDDADETAPVSIKLQTASGKFVYAPSTGAALITTINEDKAEVLEIIENPPVPPKPAQ
jgi:hypothetical protein